MSRRTDQSGRPSKSGMRIPRSKINAWIGICVFCVGAFLFAHIIGIPSRGPARLVPLKLGRFARSLWTVHLPTPQPSAAGVAATTIASSTSIRAVDDGRPHFLPAATVDIFNIDKLRFMLRSTNFSNGIMGRHFAVTIHHFRQPLFPADRVETVADEDVLYFVKACAKFRRRAQEMYKSWGRTVKNIAFSTDLPIDEIPLDKQCITDMEGNETRDFLTAATKWVPIHNAASCFLTLQNFGKVVADKRYQRIKWLVLVDDDTFVIPRNLMEYLSAFPSAKPWYLGLSNAELAGHSVGKKRFIPVTASAPGVAYSSLLLARFRAGDGGLKLGDMAYVNKMCADNMFKDDVAVGYLPLILYKAEYVARPDLRPYHFHDMPDPVHLKPLTIHTQLANVPDSTPTIFQ